MAFPQDPAMFVVRAAAEAVRADLAPGRNNGQFRDLEPAEIVDGIPIADPLEGLHEHLLAGTDPVVILSEAFTNQALAYADAAARATVTVARVAVQHLYAAGGAPAVGAFLCDLESQGESEKPSA